MTDGLTPKRFGQDETLNPGTKLQSLYFSPKIHGEPQIQPPSWAVPASQQTQGSGLDY